MVREQHCRVGPEPLLKVAAAPLRYQTDAFDTMKHTQILEMVEVEVERCKVATFLCELPSYDYVSEDSRASNVLLR